MPNINKTDFLKLSYINRIKTVAEIAPDILKKSFSEDRYELNNLIIEPVSYLENDWYLWIIGAKRTKNHPDTNKPVFDVWTLNLTSLSLNHGYYELQSEPELNEAITIKKN